MNERKNILLVLSLIFVPLSWLANAAQADTKRPNILVIMSDEVGVHNVSAYSRGLVGYQTPNIDRLAGRGGTSKGA